MTDPKVEQGLVLAEKGLQSKLGINVRLPREISVDELGRSLGFAIPHDVETVVRTAMAYGVAAVSSSVTSLLVGAGLGSIVPGLGTIVGIGVAFVGTVLADAIVSLFEEEPPAGQVPCEAKFQCPDLPPMAPLGYIAFAANMLEQATLVDAEEQLKRPCGVLGPAGLCATIMRQLLRDSVAIVDKTPAHMTMVDVEWALGVLANAAKGEYYNDWYADRAIKYKPFTAMGGDQDYSRIIVQLNARKHYLNTLAQQLGQLDALSLAELGVLRTALLEEIRNFTFAVFAAQGSDRFAGNLSELGVAIAAHDMVRGVEVSRYNTERAAASRVSTAPTVSDTQACWNLVYYWRSQNPELARALEGRDMFDMVRQCERSRAGEIEPAQMVQHWKGVAHGRARQYRRRNSVFAAFVDSALIAGNPFSRRV